MELVRGPCQIQRSIWIWRPFSLFLSFGQTKERKPKFYLICPSPVTNHFSLTSFSNAKGPLACSFCVEIPISAPRPNSSPSVNLVEAFMYTTAASTSCKKRLQLLLFSDIIASECLVEYC